MYMYIKIINEICTHLYLATSQHSQLHTTRDTFARDNEIKSSKLLKKYSLYFLFLPTPLASG